MVTSEKHEQWIAFVKTEQGSDIKSELPQSSLRTKHVGDTLHFKEYIGEIFGIDYFSHNEEDEELETALEIPSPVQ
jgi:hypothetical protein